MITIKTKNKNFSGFLSGITFINGIAKVEKLDETDKIWFESYGHIVETEFEEDDKKDVKPNKKG